MKKKLFNGNMCVRIQYIYIFHFQKNSVKQITIVKVETVITVGVETYIFTVICHFTLAIQLFTSFVLLKTLLSAYKQKIPSL